MVNFSSGLRWGWECARSPCTTFSCSRLVAIGQEPKAQTLVLPPPPPDSAAPLLCLDAAVTGPRLTGSLLYFITHFSSHRKYCTLCWSSSEWTTLANTCGGNMLTYTRSWMTSDSPSSCSTAGFQQIWYGNNHAPVCLLSGESALILAASCCTSNHSSFPNSWRHHRVQLKTLFNAIFVKMMKRWLRRGSTQM